MFKLLLILLPLTSCTYKPKFKAGDCVRFILNDNNEFVKSEPSYSYIEKVGKYSYLTRYMWKDGFAYEEYIQSFDRSHELVGCKLLEQ